MPSLLETATRWHLVITVVGLLAACASVPSSIDGLRWSDQWGGRSHQAAQRDWAMCEKLVEQRRGLLASCMTARGWGDAESVVSKP